MRVVINSRAAGIKANPAFFNWLKKLYFPRESIIKANFWFHGSAELLYHLILIYHIKTILCLIYHGNLGGEYAVLE